MDMFELALRGLNSLDRDMQKLVDKERDLKRRLDENTQEISKLAGAIKDAQKLVDTLRPSVVTDWDEIVRLGREEGKLEAVKVYREITGASIMDSKRAIEEYFVQRGLQFKSAA